MTPGTLIPHASQPGDATPRSLAPTTGVGAWAAGLGIAAAVWGLLFPFLGRLLSVALGPGARPPVPMGFGGAMVEVVLALAALTTGIVALRRHERSWLFLLGFAAAVLIGGFWLLFAAGELLFPH